MLTDKIATCNYGQPRMLGDVLTSLTKTYSRRVTKNTCYQALSAAFFHYFPVQNGTIYPALIPLSYIRLLASKSKSIICLFYNLDPNVSYLSIQRNSGEEDFASITQIGKAKDITEIVVALFFSGTLWEVIFANMTSLKM